MKAYDLTIQELSEGDGGGWIGWYSKGHHVADDFRQAVADYEGDDRGPTPRTPDPLTIPDALIHHIWWRCVPALPLTGEPGTILFEATPHSRGAFPATVCDTSSWKAARWMQGPEPYFRRLVRLLRRLPLLEQIHRDGWLVFEIRSGRRGREYRVKFDVATGSPLFVLRRDHAGGDWNRRYLPPLKEAA